MQRHHRNAAPRVGLGTLSVGIALSLMAFGMSSPAQAAAAPAAAKIGIGCLVAGGIVELAAQWRINRGGICPTSKPKLRVRYFPNPQVEGCVA